MNIGFVVMGIILMVDGLLSLLLVDDRKALWQYGRFIRIAIGAIILSVGIKGF